MRTRKRWKGSTCASAARSSAYEKSVHGLALLEKKEKGKGDADPQENEGDHGLGVPPKIARGTRTRRAVMSAALTMTAPARRILK
jgi:hypothetical protein